MQTNRILKCQPFCMGSISQQKPSLCDQHTFKWLLLSNNLKHEKKKKNEIQHTSLYNVSVFSKKVLTGDNINITNARRLDTFSCTTVAITTMILMPVTGK